MSATRSRGRTAFFTILAIVAGLALIEGLAALTLFVRGGDDTSAPLAERRHTRFDRELGWVHEPSQHVVDLYGPGRTLTTNSQGFRAVFDFDRAVPENTVRVLCSGDSFTLGWGVNDDGTWCAALEQLDPRIQTVNMGQGGYGIDQAYLWALQEEETLDHQLHLFAFISEDLQRMRYDQFQGFGKPVLRLANGAPNVENVPVPRPERLRGPWWARTRAARLALQFTGRSLAAEAEPLMPLSEAARNAVGAMTDLHRRHEERGSRFVAIWLPTIPEYISRDVDPVRTTVVGNLRAAGVHVIDLTRDFRDLSPSEVDRLFLSEEDSAIPGGGGHYSARGNNFVAVALWRRLQKLPEFTTNAAGP